jgi:AraC-like DNA-binding protein
MREVRRVMLTKTVLTTTSEVELRDVRCRSQPSAWSQPEQATAHTVVFARHGWFRRRVRGIESVVDPALAYFTRPGDEQEFAHSGEAGDSCTAIELDEGLLASMWGGEPGLPDQNAFTTPQLDLEQRFLLAAASRGADEAEVAERVVSLVSALLEQVRPERVASGRPATMAERIRVVAAAREALAVDPSIGLVELAGRVAVSPHHLSRVFRAHTGETVTRYRNRLRVRLALERLAEGDHDLARLAAELAFSDHAHLTRAIRAEVGSPPSHFRSTLAMDVR